MSLTPEQVAARDFSIDRRGYDRAEVRAFLVEVAEQLELTDHRERSEPDRYSTFGVEVASLIRTAEDSARDLVDRTNREVDELLSAARADARVMREDADHYSSSVRTEADAEAARLLAEARAQADEIRVDAQADAQDAALSSTQIRSDATALAQEVAETTAAQRAEADAYASAARSRAAETAARTVADAERRATEILTGAERDAESIVDQARDEATMRTTMVLAQAQERLDQMLTAERHVHDRMQAAVTDLQSAISRVAGSQLDEVMLTTAPVDVSVAWADDLAAEDGDEIDLRDSEPDVSAVVREAVSRALRDRA